MPRNIEKGPQFEPESEVPKKEKKEEAFEEKEKQEEKEFQPLTDEEIDELLELEGPPWYIPIMKEARVKFEQKRAEEEAKLSKEEKDERITRFSELRERREQEERRLFGPSPTEIMQAKVFKSFDPEKHEKLKKEMEERKQKTESLSEEEQMKVNQEKMKRLAKLEGYNKFEKEETAEKKPDGEK